MNHSVLLDSIYTGRVGLRINMNSDKVLINTQYDIESRTVTKKAVQKVPRHTLESVLRKMTLRNGMLVQTDIKLNERELVMLCELENECW